MIPKIIHYCWFGGNPMPSSAKRYIESWERYFPDYQIMRWDESNFDVEMIPYTREAYASKKYAFVSDYARFWILYHYGGVYFDTDVEVIASLDDILSNGPYLGTEQQNAHQITVNPGLGFAAEPEMEALKELLSQYENRHYIANGGPLANKNIVEITTEYLTGQGMVNTAALQHCAGFTIYPVEYFCPISYETRKMTMTANTKTIHHFAESWLPMSTRFKNAIGRVLGQDFLRLLVRVKQMIKKNI